MGFPISRAMASPYRRFRASRTPATACIRSERSGKSASRHFPNARCARSTAESTCGLVNSLNLSVSLPVAGLTECRTMRTSLDARGRDLNKDGGPIKPPWRERLSGNQGSHPRGEPHGAAVRERGMERRLEGWEGHGLDGERSPEGDPVFLRTAVRERTRHEPRGADRRGP